LFFSELFWCNVLKHLLSVEMFALLRTVPMQYSETLVNHSKYFSDPISTIQLKHNILTSTSGLLSSKSYTWMGSTPIKISHVGAPRQAPSQEGEVAMSKKRIFMQDWETHDYITRH